MKPWMWLVILYLLVSLWCNSTHAQVIYRIGPDGVSHRDGAAEADARATYMASPNAPSPDCVVQHAGQLLPLDDYDPDMQSLWLEYHFHDQEYLTWGGHRMLAWLRREYERNLAARCLSASVLVRDIGHLKELPHAVDYLRARNAAGDAQAGYELKRFGVTP